MDLVGQTLGQFQIVEEAGKGGMAVVYKAYQASLQRHVAIKVLSSKLTDDLDLVERFKREAQSAAALQHTNVLIIHDVGSEGDVHYIVSELLEGMTLSQLLQQEGALPAERIVNILRQVASALDYAHSRGFIHRDIKPSNIMVDPTRDDHVTLMDFGLVQVSGGSRITRTGFIMGTPDYMSPEQAKGDDIDRRTDIYSLGVTVYHMLTGDVPFSKSTPHAVLLAHIMEDPPSMSVSDREISYEIEAVVRKAMAKDPADRYDWAGDLANDLEMATTSPVSFTAPPIRPSMYPQSAPVVLARPTPLPRRQTRPPGRPQQGSIAPTPLTPAGGVTAYPPRPVRPRWLWPVAGLASFAVLATLVIVGILSWPAISAMLSGQPTPTVVVSAPTPTPTPEPAIELFVVSPTEIVQGESVTIEWRVSGVDAVTIQPNVRENAQLSGSMVHQPGETTRYRIALPNGNVREVEVVVSPAAGAPVVEFFEADPPEQVPGGEFKLSWQIAGETTRIEISRGFEMIRGLGAQDELTLVADKTTTFILNAYNGDLLSSKKIEYVVVEPTTVPTHTPVPTPTEAAPTHTPVPTATSTPTSAPPTATQPAAATATPASQPTPKPSAGVVLSFEQFGTWTRGEQPYAEFTQTQDQVKAGSYAGKLAYDYSGSSSSDDFVVFANKTAVSGDPNLVSMWVYGDQSGHFVNVWIEDAEKQVWSVHLGAITFSGWGQMSGAIDPNRPWPSGKVFGPDNGTIDYPIRFYGFVLDRPGTGPLAGQIYLDDISFAQGAVITDPGTTGTPQVVAPPSQVGRIIYTIQVEQNRYSLYATDPTWSKAVKIGDTDEGHSTCVESNTVATALDGTTVGLRPVERCQVAGTVGSCPSPNGKLKVNTNNVGDRFVVVLFNVAEDRIQESYYEGNLNIYVGLNWAPDGSHFLFTVDSSVYRADVGTPGVHQVLPYKDDRWPLQYSADGAYVMYLKPVSGAIADVFVASPDGSGERNVTNAPIATKLCPRWRQ